MESQAKAHGAPEVALNPSPPWTGRRQHEVLAGRRGDEARPPSLVPRVARESESPSLVLVINDTKLLMSCV